MKIKNLLFGIVAATGMLLGGCNSHSNDDYLENFVDFVTLDSFSDAGATMTFREKGDSPLLTLTTSQKFPADKFKAGTRIVISYITSTGLRVSGPCTIIEAAPTEGLGAQAVTKTAQETNNWATEAVSMKDLQRSGEYINFICIGSSSKSDNCISLVLDAATADNEVPEYHVVFQPKTDGAVQNYYYYCSYSISDSWANPNVKGVKIHFKDTSLGSKVVELMK